MGKLAIILLVCWASVSWAQYGGDKSNVNPSAGSFTSATLYHNTITTAATTISITTSGTSAGDTLLFLADIDASALPCQIASVNQGGTYTPLYATNGYSSSSGFNTTGGIIINASATTSPLVVTFSGTCAGAVGVYDVKLTGTPVVDGVNSSYLASGKTGPAFTPTSGNDAIFTMINATSPSAIGGSYTGTFSGNYGWAYNLAASGSAPTWTASGGSNNQVQMIALSFSSTPYANQALEIPSGSNGANVTTTTLLADGNGWKGGQFALSGSSVPTYSTTQSTPLSTASGRLNDGSSYASSTASEVITYPTSSSSGSDIERLMPYTGNTVISMGRWFCSTVPSGGSYNTDGPVQIYGSGDFALARYNDSGTGPTFSLEGSTNDGSNITGYTPDTTDACITTGWVWVAVKMDASGGHDEVRAYKCTSEAPPPCSGSPTLLGTSTGSGTSPGWTYVEHVIEAGSDVGFPTTGYNLYYGYEKISLDGTWPLLP
jgi:hypothetical protein